MKETLLKYFLIEYIRSLKERSRFEKTGFKNGLDWLLLELGIQKGWLPIRSPFSIDSNQKLQSKSEGELGADISFLSEDKKTVYVFVIKDEKLNNTNWTGADFDKDIRNATSPDMTQEGLEQIENVRIVTAYNKDEDRNGIQLYERLIKTFSVQFGEKNQYKRGFERWNLIKITEEVGKNLITPELLPNHLTSQFRYICAQIKDFDYCSNEWINQLEPNWKNFIEAVIDKNIDENKINLLALSIYILKSYWKSEEKSHAGWIDLIEWAMLALWQHYYKLSDDPKDRKLKEQIVSIWIKLYTLELEAYIIKVESALRVQHGLSLGNYTTDFNLIPINDAYRAFWHLARLGLLHRAPQDFKVHVEEYEEYLMTHIDKMSDLLVNFLYSNPATTRPLIDLHHIELYLTWIILYQSEKQNDMSIWLSELESKLTLRRLKAVNVPFIESTNNFDTVVEHTSTGNRPVDFCDSSSYLLLMLIELCFSLKDGNKRDALIKRFMQRTIKAVGDDGKSLVDEKEKNEIDLLSWAPPLDWEEKLIMGSLSREGVGITTGNFERGVDKKEGTLAERIKLFVEASRKKFPQKPPKKLPYSVCILACLKYRSPLPSEFWRGIIFQKDENFLAHCPTNIV
jgi:hypothetical protein